MTSNPQDEAATIYALPEALKTRLQTRLLATCGCTHFKSCNSCNMHGELKELERADHPTPAQAQGESVTVDELGDAIEYASMDWHKEGRKNHVVNFTAEYLLKHYTIIKRTA